MKYQEVLDKVDEVDVKIKALQDERQNVLNSMLDRAPYKVGDTVPVPRSAYVHEGKPCRITYAGVGISFIRLHFGFRAVVLKKDGKNSANDVQWNEPVPKD